MFVQLRNCSENNNLKKTRKNSLCTCENKKERGDDDAEEHLLGPSKHVQEEGSREKAKKESNGDPITK